jgi:amino acid adenylation domain-containing protein
MTDLRSRIAALTPEQRALLETRLGAQLAERDSSDGPRARAAVAIPRRDPNLPTPTSYAQQREWALERFRPGNNIVDALRLEGGVDQELFSRVLTEMTNRHEVLRSTIEISDGKLVQVVHPVTPVPVPVIDLSHLDPAEQRREFVALHQAEVRRPFPADQPQRLRATLVRLGPTTHLGVLSIHHGASDGWSAGVVLTETAAHYKAFHDGTAAELPPPPIQYGDFAVWQRQWMDGEWMAGELEHWRGVLDGIPPRLALPTDRPFPVRRTFAGDVEQVDLSTELSAVIKGYAEREGLSISMLMLAACSVLLHRYTQQDDLVFGSAITGRSRPETEALIGCFANALPLRMRIDRDRPLRSVLAEARDVASTAFEHQDLPFDRLIEEFAREETSQTPLIQMMINVITNPGDITRATDVALEMPGMRITREPVALGPVPIDLIVLVQAGARSVNIQWHYSTELFDRSTIARLAEQCAHVLHQLVTTPDTRVGDVELLSADASPAQPADVVSERAAVGFVELFRRQVAATPDAAAVRWDGAAISYAELDRAADGLARRLRALGAGPEAPVGVLLPRTPELATAMLGVLRAGGACLALDPEYPPDRIAALIADSGARLLVTNGEQLGIADSLSDVEPVLIGDQPGADGTGELPDPALTSAAYVCYTSGSTGRPKGVVVEHGSLAAFAHDIIERLGLTAADRFLQFASPGFDVLVEELFPVWVAGGAVVFPPAESAGLNIDVEQVARAEGVTVMEVPAAFWHEWVRSRTSSAALPPSLRLVIVGAERVLPERLAVWQKLGVPLAHVYGITETTVSSTFFVLAPDAPAADLVHLPIGTALPSVELAILDEDLRPVPAGAVGELYIGGVSVARGYHGDAALTAARFVADPAGSGERLYRSGDLVRRRPDGNLEFLARADTQINLRGFRVEPGEVESAICRHPQIAHAVVAVHEPAPNDRRLVGYVVPQPRTRPNLTDLRRFLEREIPRYLVPSTFVTLESLPLTGNGKVDRDRLPAPGDERPDLDEEVVAPRTPMERRLAEIVAHVLGITTVGVHDNFFDLGGDSILAIQVVARAQDDGIGLSPLDLFEHPSMAQLAEVAGAGDRPPPVNPRPADAAPVLSVDQERLWIEDRLVPGAAYHVGAQLRVVGPLDLAVLEASIAAILVRHEALRSRFPTVDGTPVQVVEPADPAWRLPVADVSGLAPQERAAERKRLAATEATVPFDLATGPLLRCLLIRLSPTEHILSVTSHHIVSDMMSVDLFGRELAALYAAGGDATVARLPELPVQFRDYAVWQREFLAGEQREREVGYWRDHLAGAPPALTMPTAHRLAPTPDARGGRFRTSLTVEETAALHALCRAHEVTPFMVVLSSLATVLGRWAGQPDVVVGVSISSRTDVATQNLIGCFINTLPLRVDLAGAPTFTELLTQVREVALGGYAHANAPLDLVIKELGVLRDPRRTPLFQVMLNVTDVPSVERIGDIALEMADTPELPSSFDLVLHAREINGATALQLEFNADRYQAPMMEILTDHLRTFLGAAAGDPDRSILDYELGGTQPAPEPEPFPELDAADRFAVLPGVPGEFVAALAAAAQAKPPRTVPGPAARDAGALAEWLRAEGITVLHAGAPILRALAARTPRPELPALRMVAVLHDGGLLAPDVDAIRRLAPAAAVVAVYGVTPDGAPSACYRVPAGWDAAQAPLRVPLGSEPPGAPATLRHPAGQPAAVGEVAEIWFGERRTGDLGRRWHDGTIEFIDRLGDRPIIRPVEVEAS